MEETKRENAAAGGAGAFLGSLLGAACIVALGQLGYMAAISGVIMAVCSLKGYELLGGGLTRKGAAISGVLVVLMTYFANRLDWAISVARAFEVDVLLAFQAIGPLLKRGVIGAESYWGGLAMLYIFTLIGAAPTIAGGLRGGSQPASAPPRGTFSWDQPQQRLYPAERSWMTPVLLSAAAAMITPLVLAAAVLPALFATNSGVLGMTSVCAMAGVMVMIIYLIKTVLVTARVEEYTFVRGADGVLWRVRQGRLNLLPEYRYTRKSDLWQSISWDRLDREERARLEDAVRRAIETVSGGRGGLALGRLVVPLRDLELVEEDSWHWTVSYQDSFLRRRMQVGKAYPGLRLTPEAGLAEERAPFQWGLLAKALCFAAAWGAAGFALSFVM